MYFSFENAMKGYTSPLNIHKLIGDHERVCIENVSHEYTKIYSIKYSMYFQKNKMVLITKNDEQIKSVFINVDDAIKCLFTSSNL
jgi:hypothetical protein